MSDDSILAALSRLEAGQGALMTRMDSLETGQTRLRVDLMERMDRLQHRLDVIDENVTMALGHSDAVEQKSDGVVEQNRILREQMMSMHKLLRMLESRVNALEERK